MSRGLLDAFDKDFIRELKSARNNPEAYDKATEKWERSHGFVPYDGYDAFRKRRARARKKRR